MAASVRQQLLNRARAQEEDFQVLLNRYVVERFLYRLSRSNQRDRFVVKGAMLFVLWEGDLHRTTRDLDLLGFGANSVPELEQAVRQILQTDVEEDGVGFASETVRGERMGELREYEGVRLTADARVGAARIRLKMDVGFGDAITPGAQEAKFPTLLNTSAPVLWVYPKETVIAEKVQAMVALGMLNSRMKDFLDLWHLARHDEFDGATVADAVRATFARRRTSVPEATPMALTAEFAGDDGKRTQWQAFVRRGKLREEVSLDEVITLLRLFLLPILQSARSSDAVASRWRPGGPWK